MRAGQREVLAELRQRIERIDGGYRKRTPLPFGLDAMDRHLPGGGLARGALHEFIESGPASEFASCTTSFAAGVAARLNGPVLWCRTRDDLNGPGLALAGLHPDRVLHVRAGRDSEILPLVEEGLREKGLGAVVAEVTRLGLTESRRIQLAAEENGVTALVIRRWWTAPQRKLTEETTASVSRWRIGPAPSERLPAPGIGRARWRVELVRCRGGEPRTWIVGACDSEGRLALPAQADFRGARAASSLSM